MKSPDDLEGWYNIDIELYPVWVNNEHPELSIEEFDGTYYLMYMEINMGKTNSIDRLLQMIREVLEDTS